LGDGSAGVPAVSDAAPNLCLMWWRRVQFQGPPMKFLDGTEPPHAGKPLGGDRGGKFKGRGV